MTRAPTAAERALAAMREQRLPEDSELAKGAQRRRMVARVEGFQAGLLRDDRRRRRVVPWLATGLMLAAAAAVALGSALKAPAPLSSAVPAARAELAPAKLVAERGAVDFVRQRRAGSPSRGELFPGDEVRTREDGGVTLLLALGAKVELGPSTAVELSNPGPPAGKSESVRLVRGRIELSVPKQPDGASFSVTAPLAKVVVLGTEFSVTASEHGPTMVEVKQGRVLVEHGSGSTFLDAGATWTSERPFEPGATASAAASAVSSVRQVDSALTSAVEALREVRPLASA
ncbi:MAG TPA: FecR family protein, partial [Polyangiaceae bacterium]|nr:FecR family protein [Polyangiaceae bacterium]